MTGHIFDLKARLLCLQTLGSKNKKIILMCAVGGTLDTNVSYRREKKIFADPERQFGRESRSLKAAYELLEVSWVLFGRNGAGRVLMHVQVLMPLLHPAWILVDSALLVNREAKQGT